MGNILGSNPCGGGFGVPPPLYIAKHVRGDLVVRLGNLQVTVAFAHGPWFFRRNWLHRTDRDLASLAWCLANGRQLAGLGSTTVRRMAGPVFLLVFWVLAGAC